MVASVQLQILRRKSQHIRHWWSSHCLTQSFVEIVPIVKIRAAGARRQIIEDLRLRRLGRSPVQRFRSRNAESSSRRIRDVAHHVGRIKPSGINRVDHDVRPRRSIDDVELIAEQLRQDKSRRNKHHDSLAGHRRQPPHCIFDVPVNKLRLGIAPAHRLRRRRRCHRSRHRGLGLVPIERAIDSLRRRYFQRLRIVLVLYQVALVIADIRAIR